MCLDAEKRILVTWHAVPLNFLIFLSVEENEK
jgi:hypothetical protein